MSDWDEVVFSEIIDINNYPSLEKNEVYTHVGMSDVGRYERKIKNTNKKEYKYSCPRFKNGDTLVGRMSHSLRTGKMAFVDILEKDEVAFGSTEFIVMRPKDNRILPKYVYYTMRQDSIVQNAINWTSGTTANRERVPNEFFDNIKIKIPPIKEQKQIIDLLDSIDEKIQSNKETSKLLEKISHKIYESWFIKNEFGFSDIKTTNLYSIAKYINGSSFNQDKIKTDGEPIIKIKELKEGINHNTDYYPKKSDIDKKYHLKQNDILFSWSASFDVYTWTKNEGLLNQHIFKVKPIEYYTKEFVYHSLKYIISDIKNIATGTTMTHIKRSDLKDIQVPDASSKLVSKFTKRIRPFRTKIINLNQENEKLEQLRDYLLPLLLSGEINIDDENEEVMKII